MVIARKMILSHNVQSKGSSVHKYRTCNPSKKLSPIMITVDPPVVHPSLGEIALITGMADVGYNPGYSAEIKYLKVGGHFMV